ncbi:MAG: PEP-CTERM sorting domain-containing protein [Akkermansiaceae bacterium]
MINKKSNASKALQGLLTLALVGSTNAALVGHWAFDEGSGTTAGDSSAGGNDGAISNATWGSDATRASYLSFNGTTSSVVDPSMSLPVMTSTNDFTWAVWANTAVAPRNGNGSNNSQTNAVILGNRKDGANSDLPSTANRQFIKFTPTNFEWHQNANGNDNQAYADLVVGEWTHLAVVKTGTSIQLYQNGAAIGGPATLTEDLSTAVAMPLFIGGDVGNSSVNEAFNGFIDDVRIYDNALSLGEVQVLAGVPEPSSLLLGAVGFGMMLRRKR